MTVKNWLECSFRKIHAKPVKKAVTVLDESGYLLFFYIQLDEQLYGMAFWNFNIPKNIFQIATIMGEDHRFIC